jgi:gamma-glutamyltranspeptidase/glutathione hydrolase
MSQNNLRPRRRYQRVGWVLACCLGIAVTAGGQKSASQAKASVAKTTSASLSPAAWPAEEREQYVKLEQEWGTRTHTETDAVHGMVSGTSGAFAVHAGVKALEAGGSAVDAALTTSLAQIALTAGSFVSYAGFMNGLYYEAKTGKVYSFNAAYNIPKAETDPLSIPEGGNVTGTPSGRTALVPGFMAGVQALHDRFGKLPFAAIFSPAVYLAENGLVVTPYLAGSMEMRRTVLSRLPETRAVFFKADGSAYKAGEIFRQPALAETLGNVAQHGAAYMYRGPWAKHLVEAVQRDGGHMTMEDLASYKVLWQEPIKISYHGYEVYAMPRPNVGGHATLAGLNLLEAADVRKLGPPTKSADALYDFIQITRAPALLGFGIGFEVGEAARRDKFAKQFLSDIDFSDAGLLNKDNMRRLWQKIESPTWAQVKEAASKQVQEFVRDAQSHHSAAVVAADSEGNIVALTHTINTMTWGTTGINVGGISIPDSAAFQQVAIRDAIRAKGPGGRLPDPANPVMVLRSGKAFLGGSSIGMGLYDVTLQSLVHILDFGMEPQAAVNGGQFVGPALTIAIASTAIPTLEATRAEAVPEGVFSDAIVEAVRAKGQPIEVWPKRRTLAGFGSWVTIEVDPWTHHFHGGVSPYYNGNVEGH